jgi:sugar lactone lactonase YvrE
MRIRSRLAQVLCLLTLAAASGCAASPFRRAPYARLPIEVIAQGVPSPDGLALGVDGNLYVACERKHAAILRITPDGLGSVVAIGLRQADGLQTDAAGTLYVSEERPDGRVVQVAPDGRQAVIAPGLVNPEGLAFDSAGRLYVAEDRAADRILRIEEGRVLVWAEGLSRPEGIEYGPDGDLYVNETARGQLTRIHPDGTRELFVPGGRMRAPDGLAYCPAYDGFFVTEDSRHGRLWFVTRDGRPMALTDGLNRPQGLVCDTRGTLFVSEQGRNRVLKVPPLALEQALAQHGVVLTVHQ